MSYKKKSVPKYIMNIYIVMIVLTSSWDLTILGDRERSICVGDGMELIVIFCSRKIIYTN